MNRPPAIAIVGMGGIFPGAADLDAFWRNILAGLDTTRDVPAHRWIIDPARALAQKAEPDRVYSLRGCFVDDFTCDPYGLDIDPDLLAALDPLCHLVLHAGRAAFTDAVTQRLDRRRIGVILAAIALPTDASSAITREILGQAFENRLLDKRGTSAAQLRTHPLNSHVTGLPAALLAQALQLGGGSYTLDAACASSLYALKLACDELREGRADAMLAGGVSRPECLYTQMGFSQLLALSKSGRCAPFDASCDGLIVGEGAGIVMLKRLDNALRDGDQVYGIIRGIGLSNDIGGSLLAPDSEGQLRAMREAYEQAAWSPADVNLIECHGTGTPTGDVVEIASLRTLWQDVKDPAARCPIGSVKSMIGHLLTGAGAAGLIKVLLAMRHQTLPTSANYVGGGRVIPLEDSPFRVQTAPEPWRPRLQAHRRAAISAFGFGGINAHVLIEEFADQSRVEDPPRRNCKGAPVNRSTATSCVSAKCGIAVVGLSAHFGAARSLAQFEKLIFAGNKSLGDRPAHRWDGADEIADQLIGSRADRGAYLDVWPVPVGKYRLPPAEIPEVLPQQLLMLEAVAAALEDAKMPLRQRRPRVGAIVGMALDLGTTNFHLRWWIEGRARRWADELGLDLDENELEQWTAALKDAAGPALNAARTVGALGGMIASRIAREFQLGGPSYAVSCGEASGLRALEISARALARNEIDAAVVGAVDLAGDIRSVVTSTMLRGGDDDSDFMGEGAAAVVLKRFEDAQSAGDRIYAVIDFGDENHAVGEIIAAHSELGRTGAADGLASFVKAALCLHHEILPPKARDDSPSYWWRNRVDGPRRAVVTSPSLDGVPVNIVLSEPEQRELSHNPKNSSEALFAIEADDARTLLAGIDELSFLASQQPQSMLHLARSWRNQNDRSPDRRLALAAVATSPHELLEALSRARSALTASPDHPLDGRGGVFYNPAPLGRMGQLAFVFPGSGNHYPNMGQSIALRWPEIARALDGESQHLRSQFIEGQLHGGNSADDADIHRTIFRQVSYCVLMSDLLRRLGLAPQAVIGYSLGESAGLFALRAWPDRDEMLRRMSESPLFKTDLAGPRRALRAAWNLPESQPVDWTAAVVGRSADAVREALRGIAHARLLIVNTPKECVIGGLGTDVAEVAKRLKCRAVTLDGIPTVHFEAARQVEGAYRELHLLQTTPPDGVRFYSAGAARAYDVTRTTAAESITAQALQGFDFPALIQRAHGDGVRLFVEVGPQASCTRMIGKILTDRPHFARSASARGDEEVRSVFNLAAALIAERIPIDLDFLLGPEERAAASTITTQDRTVLVEIGRRPVTPPMPARRPRRHQPALALSDLHEPVAALAAHNTDSLAVEWSRTTAAAASAHRAYLQFSETAAAGMASALAFQSRILETIVGSGADSGSLADLFVDQSRDCKGAPSGPSNIAQRSLAVAALNEVDLVFPRALCLEFARGSVANVLGPDFAEVDTHPTRVRLPDEPLMLVDRIMQVEGVKGSMTGGRVVTEHDVFADAWYLDGGRAPICITVEAGQADLFLSAYLGIDRITRGLRTYRLLDATVTFHRGLPRPGETIRYDIRIEKFVRQGETYLFFFQFDGTIEGVPVLTMRNGCAGFFTADEIHNSRGIVLTPEESSPAKGHLPADWRPLVPMAAESYDDSKLAALRRGDLAGCFGPPFAHLPIADPLRLPDGRMKLIDRVTQLDPAGGRYGLGIIRAEADIHPDDWFLTCHFVDDMVMPGTLMYECCAHTLRMFLLRLGWVGEQSEICYEPVAGVSSSLRCRGPVTPKTRVVTYQVEIKELGYRPEPYVLADAMMYADGEAIVRMTNMSLQLTGATRERIGQIWAQREDRTRGKLATGFITSTSSAPVFSREQILAFCIGNPSDCFGEPYRIFDHERKCARLPGPPYCFLDRVTIAEPEMLALKPGGWIECEYDVPENAWYFAANRQPSMPYAVLLEIALQPCGFLAAYAGSALTSETDLSFRNLGGTATLHEEVFARCGTLRTRVRMTDVSRAGGMIIEQFDMEVRSGDRLIFDGTTSFGFFSKASLAQQVGIRDAKQRLYIPTANDAATAKRFVLPDNPPFTPDDAAIPNSAFPVPNSGLPARAFRMIDKIDALLPDGGPHGLGFIQGSTNVDPSAWFFKAHFYQDPVWPGSLGLESFQQLLKVFALDHWPDLAATHRFEPILVGTPHTWAYRGQIIPANRHVEVQAVITRREDSPTPVLMADGFLSVDGIIIYEMRNFGMELRPGCDFNK